MKTGWELLVEGDYESAILRFHEEDEERGNRSNIRNIGLALLCLKRWEDAKSYSDALIEEYPKRHSIDYARAGFARWFNDECDDAIQTWKVGLKCGYSDAASGMEIPLLLFYASIRRPDLINRDEAETLIHKKLENRRSRYWPGPLGRFVLGEVDEGEARQLALFRQPKVERRRTTQLEFYVGLIALIHNDQAVFFSKMEQIKSEQEFKSLNEWHLACYELDQAGKGIP